MYLLLFSLASATDLTRGETHEARAEAPQALAVPEDALGSGVAAPVTGSTAALKRRLVGGPPLRSLRHRVELGLHADYSLGLVSMTKAGGEFEDNGLMGFDVLAGGLSLSGRIADHWWIGLEMVGGGEFIDGLGRNLLDARLSAVYTWGRFNLRPEVGVEAGPAFFLTTRDDHDDIENDDYAIGAEASARVGMTFFPSAAAGFRLALRAGASQARAGGPTFEGGSVGDGRTPQWDARVGLATTLVIPVTAAARM